MSQEFCFKYQHNMQHMLTGNVVLSYKGLIGILVRQGLDKRYSSGGAPTATGITKIPKCHYVKVLSRVLVRGALPLANCGHVFLKCHDNRIKEW